MTRSYRPTKVREFKDGKSKVQRILEAVEQEPRSAFAIACAIQAEGTSIRKDYVRNVLSDLAFRGAVHIFKYDRSEDIWGRSKPIYAIGPGDGTVPTPPPALTHSQRTQRYRDKNPEKVRLSRRVTALKRKGAGIQYAQLINAHKQWKPREDFDTPENETENETEIES